MDELNRRGEEVVRDLYGDRYDKVLGLLESLDKRLVDHAVGFTYGQVYESINLEPGTRELILIAVLAAMNYPDQMVTHIIAAQQAGVTERAIRDTLVLLGPVAGIPCVIEGLKRVQKVFDRNREKAGEPTAGENRDSTAGHIISQQGEEP
jgi:alkylhydroperoxidase/carboxymuconolactone decarboxylase family protein YurZ